MLGSPVCTWTSRGREVDKPIIKHVAAAVHEAMTLYAGSAE